MRLPSWLSRLAHRRGWLASPSLAFMGVPFGPDKRDLLAEIGADMARRHNPATCPLCTDGDADDQP